MVEVTKADRDAAAEIIGSDQHSKMMRSGDLDEHSFVQAFAKHRIAERERCAGICDEMEQDQNGRAYDRRQAGRDDTHNCAKAAAARQLAHAIRSYDEPPSARITGDKGRENPAEGAPPHTPMGAAVVYAQKRIAELEAGNALLRRALAYAQRQQLSLMDERTRYQVALIRIAEVEEGGLAEYTPQAMVAQARQALAQAIREQSNGA